MIMMTSSDTLSTDIPNCELEAKRQAVLASMKRKSSQSSSRNLSPVPANTPIEGNDTASTMKDHNKLKSDLYDAILDLRALGFSFEMIIAKSGVNRDFLAQCYTEWKFPIPKVEPKQPVISSKFTSNSAPNSFVKSTSATPNDMRSNSNTPKNVYQRPMFNNKVYRVDSDQEKPEWLKNLVIDLAESSEEEDDDSDEDENDSDEDDYDPTTQATTLVSGVGESLGISQPSEMKSSSIGELMNQTEKLVNNKKRKLSENDFEKRKNELSIEIKDLSDEITVKEEDIPDLGSSIEKLDIQLHEKENQLSWLRQQVAKLESESSSIEETIARKRKEAESFLQLKNKLGDKLAELDELEKEELLISESEKRRLELKERLIQQMKLKKQRKEAAEKEKEMVNQVEVSNETIQREENNNSDLVSADTIHKIPKVINTLDCFPSKKKKNVLILN